MQARRVLIAFIVAVAISGGFTLWLSKTLARRHGANSGSLHYVAVTRAVDAGETLSAQDVTPLEWPGKPVPGALTRTEDVAGKATLSALAPGVPVLDKQVSSTAAGLSGKIPEGMRAMSLKSNDVVGVAGYLLPGTRVDVLVTLHEPGSQDSVTSTVLQDAQVMTAGQKMQPDPDGKAARVDVVTLLVSPEDAEKVALASAQGAIQFVLRNGADHAHTATEPIHFAKFSIPQPVHSEAPKVAATHAPPPVPHYSVQVRRGDKDSVETF
jgi:pilus assembly protein CpaB